MKAKIIVVLSNVVLLTACAGVPEVSIDPAKFNGHGQNIATTTHTKEREFSLYTKGDQVAAATAAAMGAIPIFGVLGAALAAGTVSAVGSAVKSARLGFTIEDYSKENNITDPKNAIEKAIVTDLAKKYNLTYSGSAKMATDGGAKLEDIVTTNPDYPYVLDVTTTRWVLTEGETDQFSMNYSAALLLVEKENKTVVAQGACNYQSGKADIDLPKLKSNDTTQFKNETELAVQACVQQFSEKYLALKNPATVSGLQQ